MSCGIAVFDVENSSIKFLRESAINFANGCLYFAGKVCSRQEVEAYSSSVNGHLNTYPENIVNKLDSCKSSDEIVNVLDGLIGGWAVICYRKKKDLQKLIVGRDAFGRKSLLWKRMDEKICFSDFACTEKYIWHDVPSGSITVFDLCCKKNSSAFYIFEISRTWTEQFGIMNITQRKSASNRLTLTYEVPLTKLCISTVAETMLERLKEAVERTLSDLNHSLERILLSFSGGVDSLLIAHVMAHCIQSNVLFDLANVAFDKEKEYDRAPDRQQSLKAFKFLRSCYPGRFKRLILVNVDMDELEFCRKKYIAKAVAPAYTVLDDSVGCVVWFAARGEGVLFSDKKELVYGKSEAKIVIAGSGADELFGGYMRHRTTYLKSGRKAVLEELHKELKNIGERNLGRDDRVVSSFDKDLRSPFLDDLFVEWVASLPLEYKTDFDQPRGIGEKRLIREALRLLGTPEVLCTAPKRAMQFGSRIAKLESRNEKGSDFCSRFLESKCKYN
ncbi:unnamed protein product [Thelazia callipaeda]|uniref:Asparagine synthetase domain-containing protein n=1 Tax=Thelazia callipaeda TaxID=103827 RepID=A0A0N5CLZ4_THECL|nr:unnamed protein product [Thelazia callipaeda]